jgi:hypothetical protein
MIAPLLPYSCPIISLSLPTLQHHCPIISLPLSSLPTLPHHCPVIASSLQSLLNLTATHYQVNVSLMGKSCLFITNVVKRGNQIFFTFQLTKPTELHSPLKEWSVLELDWGSIYVLLLLLL